LKEPFCLAKVRRNGFFSPVFEGKGKKITKKRDFV